MFIIFQEWEKTLSDNKQFTEIDLHEGMEFLHILKGVLAKKELFIAKEMNTRPDSISLESLRELRRVTELMIAISDLIENPSAADLAFYLQKDRGKGTLKLTVQPFDIAYIFSKLFRGGKNLFMSATIVADGNSLRKTRTAFRPSLLISGVPASSQSTPPATASAATFTALSRFT